MLFEQKNMFLTLLLVRGQSAGSDGVGPQKKTGPTKSRKPEVALSINVGEFR